MNTGIDRQTRIKIANKLNKLLADSYTLYLMTHNFHWNVTGPMFTSLHALFETHYTEYALAVDEIAERIRALGVRAAGSYQEYAQLTDIKENVTDLSDKDMIQQSLDANETVVRTARSIVSLAADAGDEPTVDLLTQRMQAHEKNAWMLRSLLA